MEPDGANVVRIGVEVPAKPFVPGRFICPEIPLELSSSAINLKGPQLAGAASNYLPDKSGLEIADIDQDDHLGIALHSLVQLCPGAHENPERALFPEKPHRPYCRPVRRNTSDQGLREKCVDVEGVCRHLPFVPLRWCSETRLGERSECLLK